MAKNVGRQQPPRLRKRWYEFGQREEPEARNRQDQASDHGAPTTPASAERTSGQTKERHGQWPCSVDQTDKRGIITQAHEIEVKQHRIDTAEDGEPDERRSDQIQAYIAA